MPLYVEPHLVQPPLALWAWPVGKWGIIYDLYTNRIQAALPDGWETHRSSVYQRLKTRLQNNHFERAQYSVWHSDDDHPASPLEVWLIMMDLRLMPPAGQMSSVIRRLQMHFVPVGSMIVQDEFHLGGLHSPQLYGPTPAELVPGDVPGVVPGGAWPPQPWSFNFPGVAQSARALNRNNWLCAPGP